jgi:hypothetical protein
MSANKTLNPVVPPEVAKSEAPKGVLVAKKETEHEVILLPGATLERFTAKSGKEMRKIILGEISCLLFEKEQVEEVGEGLHVPAHLGQPTKQGSRWSTVSPPFEKVDPPAEFGGKQAMKEAAAQPGQITIESSAIVEKKANMPAVTQKQAQPLTEKLSMKLVTDMANTYTVYQGNKKKTVPNAYLLMKMALEQNISTEVITFGQDEIRAFTHVRCHRGSVYVDSVVNHDFPLLKDLFLIEYIESIERQGGSLADIVTDYTAEGKPILTPKATRDLWKRWIRFRNFSVRDAESKASSRAQKKLLQQEWREEEEIQSEAAEVVIIAEEQVPEPKHVEKVTIPAKQMETKPIIEETKQVDTKEAAKQKLREKIDALTTDEEVKRAADEAEAKEAEAVIAEQQQKQPDSGAIASFGPRERQLIKKIAGLHGISTDEVIVNAQARRAESKSKPTLEQVLGNMAEE